MKACWILYDPVDMRLTAYDTEEEARKELRELVDHLVDDCEKEGSWHDDVERVVLYRCEPVTWLELEPITEDADGAPTDGDPDGPHELREVRP